MTLTERAEALLRSFQNLARAIDRRSTKRLKAAMAARGPTLAGYRDAIFAEAYAECAEVIRARIDRIRALAKKGTER